MANAQDAPVLTLYTRPACHLCDVAKQVLGELGTQVVFRIRERNVDDDPAWTAAWGHEVPVAFLGDRKVFKYRVDRGRLLRLLKRC